MKTSFNLGTRGSRLAMIQAESTAARLQAAIPGLAIKVIKIVTSGDRDRRTQLEEMGPNVFVKELEEALLDGRIDLAVHSLKDVPTALPSGLGLLAVTEREDPRDALVAAVSLDELAPGSMVATGSLRRSLQLTRYRPDLVPTAIRGNMDTRVRKATSGEVDGVIVAAAAMARLGWSHKISQYLAVEHFLPAAGQGAIALEARLTEADIREMTAPLNHLVSWQCVMAERSFLAALGGGCRAPIAALATVDCETLTLIGLAISPDGKRMLRLSEKGRPTTAVEIGRHLAQRMLEMGAGQFIAEVRANEG